MKDRVSMKKGLVAEAQSGGVAKGKPNTGKAFSGKGGDGLKTAWANQTAKPSVLTNMDAAKKKVR